jgi:hypothetical protein
LQVINAFSLESIRLHFLYGGRRRSGKYTHKLFWRKLICILADLVEDNANTSVSDFLQILVQILTVVAVPEKLDKIFYVVFTQLIQACADSTPPHQLNSNSLPWLDSGASKNRL